jgi:hypothetical protein
MGDHKDNIANTLYLEERKALFNASLTTAQSFDKSILTLAASALGISLTFIKQIAPNPNPNTLWLLFGAWLLFALSILSTLIAILMSQEASLQAIEIVEQLVNASNRKTPNNGLSTCTKIFNYASIFLFALGTAALTTFCALNLMPGK